MTLQEKQLLKKTDNVSIRIDSDLSSKLHEKCLERKISLNTLINHLLDKQVNWHELTTEMGWIPMFRSTFREISDSIPRDKIEKIAEAIKDSKNCLYLGRGFNFPVALEGALKLKEISYIHAEGYPAAEMKHGPIALIDENMPTVVIATSKGHYEKVVSNIREIQSRKGKIIAIVTEGDKDVKEIADYYIEVPETIESLTPLITTIPLQLLSYHIAVKLGKNVDQPRNLAKSVTVE